MNTYKQFIAFTCLFFLASCKPIENEKPQKEGIETSSIVIKDLIERKLLRVDINFNRHVCEPNTLEESEICVSWQIHNLSNIDLYLRTETILGENALEIREVKNDEQIASWCSAQTMPSSGLSKFKADSSSMKLPISQSYDCFHTETRNGKIEFCFNDDLYIQHKMFPEDRLYFSIDKYGILTPKLDLKIQNRLEIKKIDGVHLLKNKVRRVK